jgi:hypothetical protein
VLQRPCPKTQTRRKSHYPWTKNGGQVSQANDQQCAMARPILCRAEVKYDPQNSGYNRYRSA